MSVDVLYNPNGFTLDESITDDTHIVSFDLGSVVNIRRLTLAWWAKWANELAYCYINYSFDNVNWVSFGAFNGADDISERYQNEVYLNVNEQFIYFKFNVLNYAGETGQLVFSSVELVVTDLNPDIINVYDSGILADIGLPAWSGYSFFDDLVEVSFPYIVTQVEGGGGGGDGVTPDPTSTNLITGNVEKLSVPFAADIVAVSIGIDPKVVGSSTSDGTTGDYSIDVYPHVDEVLLYVAPSYGRKFESFLVISTGAIVHPTTPNKYVYVAQNDGTVGNSEPTWNIAGDTTSGDVVFKNIPLHRPLINGFIKPTITPIP